MMLTSLLLSIAVLTSGSYAREFNCTINESLCTGSGVQAITMNGARMCCPATASISVTANGCTCVESPTASTVQMCRRGVAQCRIGASFSRDSNNEMLCCLPGFSLQMGTVDVTGGQQDPPCTCTPINALTGLGLGGPMGGPIRGLLNGFGSQLFGSGLTGILPQVAGQNGKNSTNSTNPWQDFGAGWKDWTQQIGQGFRSWGQNMGQDLRKTGLDLARNLSGVLRQTVGSATGPIQSALSNVFSSIFRSIPSV